MAKRFEKSSGGIIYRENAFGNFEILLLERKNQKGKKIYVLPKGRIEKDEKAKETALREIGEETGLPIKDLEIIKFITKINFTFVASYLNGNPTINKDVYLFLVKYVGNKEPEIVQKDPQEKGERFTGYKWFKIDELKKVDLKPDIYGYIKKNIQYM